jgi:hypothetical protein
MVAAALMVAGCGAQEPRAAEQSPSSVTTKRTQSFETKLTVEDQSFRFVGPNDEKAYGLSEYSGMAEFLDETFEAELLAASDYTGGNGTIEGFVTLQSPSGDIGMRLSGTTLGNPDDPGATFTGETEVIGGTGEYANLAGRGDFTGQRDGPPGSPVSVDVSLELINLR